MAKTPAAALEFMRGIVPAARARAARNANRPIFRKSSTTSRAVSPWRPGTGPFMRSACARQNMPSMSRRSGPTLRSIRATGWRILGCQPAVWHSLRQAFDIRYIADVRVWENFRPHRRGHGAVLLTSLPVIPNRAGHGWGISSSNPSSLLPVRCSDVCNYQKPANGGIALLSWDDVITLFHEFGHTLHGLFASQRFATLSGTNTPRDFVEFPSQINEHWASHPQVFSHYARHYETGEPMPDALRESMLNATHFNKL